MNAVVEFSKEKGHEKARAARVDFFLPVHHRPGDGGRPLGGHTADPKIEVSAAENKV
jgi:hypothetical protein